MIQVSVTNTIDGTSVEQFRDKCHTCVRNSDIELKQLSVYSSNRSTLVVKIGGEISRQFEIEPERDYNFPCSILLTIAQSAVSSLLVKAAYFLGVCYSPESLRANEFLVEMRQGENDELLGSYQFYFLTDEAFYRQLNLSR